MLLKKLTELNGVSGSEEEVRDFIKAEAAQYADEIRIDSIGNLIVFKKGINQTDVLAKHKIMLSAHMDEVGLMVIGYGENGTIKFKDIGGVLERILPGKRVFVGEKKIPGVIGCKTIHLQEKDERQNNFKMKNLYIDIGAEKKEEAEKLAPLGEYIAFDSEYIEFGEDCIKARALDDRVGCAVMLEALKGEYTFDLYACFTVQEEVGLRGAEVAAFQIEPDIALILEGTTCSDVPDVEEYDYSTLLGGGAALTIMDRTSYCDRNLVSFIHDLAKKKSVSVQFKKTTTGGNDAGRIQRSRSGVKVASISVPCRYIHSPVSVMSRKDFDSVRNITRLVLDELSSKPGVIETIKNGGSINV